LRQIHGGLPQRQSDGAHPDGGAGRGRAVLKDHGGVLAVLPKAGPVQFEGQVQVLWFARVRRSVRARRFASSGVQVLIEVTS